MAETKRNKIIRFLKKNNYDFEETYDYKIIVRNIIFEGFHCKKVKLDFFREAIWMIDADLGVFEDENLFKSTYDKLSTTFYGVQNEAYMSRSAEKWVRGLCFNELGVDG